MSISLSLRLQTLQREKYFPLTRPIAESPEKG